MTFSEQKLIQNVQVPRNTIRYKALEPEGGASDVGLSIKHYAEANKIDVVVMGSRGMGAIRRAVMSFVGLGSVSEWCVANLTCPVIIVRGKDEKHG
jgi:nucleotide-binding universal stress UspA family protein